MCDNLLMEHTFDAKRDLRIAEIEAKRPQERDQMEVREARFLKLEKAAEQAIFRHGFGRKEETHD